MSWVIFALFTHLCWSFTNIADKVVITNKIKNPFVYLFLGFILSVSVLTFGLFTPIAWPTLSTLFFTLVSSAFYLIMCVSYIKAVSLEEISRIGMIWNIAPIFGLGTAWFFLGEKLNSSQFAALAILIVGAFLASSHIKKQKIKFSNAFIYMIFACICFSLYAVAVKHALRESSFATFYFFFTLWLVPLVATFFIFKNFRVAFKEEKKNLTWRLILMVLLISIIARLGIMFNQQALARGSVALVNAMEGFQTIFMFVAAALLTKFRPDVLREELDKNNLFLKVIALVLMVGGVAYLSLQ